MIIVDIKEAKKILEKLIDRVLGGERVLISIKGKPVAELISVNKNQKLKID